MKVLKLCDCANIYDKSTNQTRRILPASPGFFPKRIWIYNFIWRNQHCHPYSPAMQLTQLTRMMLKARLLVCLSWERPFTKMLNTIKVSAVTFLLSYSSFTCTLNFGDGFCTTERWKAVACVLITSDYSMSPHVAVRENINYFLSGLQWGKKLMLMKWSSLFHIQFHSSFPASHHAQKLAYSQVFTANC